MKKTLLTLLLLALWAPFILAQEHPNQARGFAADKIYQAGEVDQVNIFNGNLSLTLGIGQRYPVNAGFSYGLTLTYNSNLWKYEEEENFTPPNIFTPATVARPDPAWNAGFGWMLHMGRLFAPFDPTFNDSTRWTWVSPDGSRHIFYPTLHEGESDEEPTNPPALERYWYTRDNTYLRLDRVARTIEFPDGTKHTFAANSHVSRLEDKHGNFLNVNTTSATQWILSDRLGRTHTINFGGSFIEGTRQVSSIQLKAFNGQTATYTFTYENATFTRTCKDTWWGNNAGGQSTGVDQITVPLLKQITGPEGIVFKMQEASGAADYHRGAVPTQPECLHSGAIESLELPTKGKLSWTYQLWRFPGYDGTLPMESNHVPRGLGVATRTVTDPWSGDGTWAYASAIFPDPGSAGNPAREVRTTVTDPLGNSVKHFFTAPQTLDPQAYSGWEYGLPFSWGTTEAGKYLSSETRDASSSLKRSQWVSYTHDQLGPTPFNEPSVWYDSNRRVNAERTKFVDDGNKVLDSTPTDFDGLGHYRATTRVSDFDTSASDSRTTRVQFNGSRCYEINLATNQQTCTGSLAFVPLATNAPWILNTFTYRQANQGGIARTFTSFEAQTGFLQCERIVKAGTSIGASDVLIVYEKEIGTGNVKSESYYGGDLQGLSTAANCTAPSSFWYKTEHTYSAGVRASSRAFRPTSPSATAMPFFSYDAVIDANTGLTATSRDTAGYPTVYTYDLLGRLKVAGPPVTGVPATEKGAKTCYNYPAIGGGPAKVQILRDVPAGATCAGSPFGESELSFDGFGRVWKERVKMADGSWSKRVTSYGAQGWKGSVSEQIPDTTGDFALPATRFQGFDAFGRPGKVLPPDAVDGNSPHAITLSYAGVRQVSRTVNVATAAGSETASTTTENYDGHGRLLKVQEPNGAGTATVATNYQYDVGNRLTRVCQGASGSTCGQQRLFGYDNRGFLLSETHPEKGTAGNGTVTYGDYDARGHAGFKTDGVATNKLAYSYDKAERLLEVREDGALGRLLKKWSYDTASGRGGGKLHQAQGYNYFPALGATANVVETYGYGEIEGRVSDKTSLLQFNGASQELFTQAFDYDVAGELTRQTYPSCTGGGCGSPGIADRPVTCAYTNGYLTSVPGWASVITYHANGMVAAVAHTNGVTDSIAVKAGDNWMRRPSRLSTTGVAFAQNFDSGELSYDGAGNIRAMGADVFLYDRLSRLKDSTVRLPSWVGGTARSQGYAFDDFGSITAVSGTNARSTPTSSSTNRLTGAGVSYDAAGNLTCWGGTFLCNGTSYQYDRLNRLQRMTTAAGPAQEDWVYVYTADDERFWSLKVNGSGSLWSLRDLSGNLVRQFEAHVSWSTTKDSIFRDGQLVASVHPADGTRHYHLDHLGTPRLTTTPAAQMIAHHTYFPFGEEVAGSTTDGERLKFTGHERDLNNLGGTGDDLDYMHARFHSPVTGRFLSVDRSPKSIRLGRAQTWNRYSYVLGNPLKYIDPSGELWFRINGQWTYLAGVTSIANDSTDAEGNSVVTVIAGRERFVGFNGGELTLYDTDGSMKAFTAVSGRGGVTQPELQAVRDVGPIPEGRYYFNPALVQDYYRHANIFDRLAGVVGKGGWPWGVSAWGRQRVSLTTDPATETYGREGFFIHGGSSPGSAGCIDLCDQADDFFSTVGSEPGELLVEVDYP